MQLEITYMLGSNMDHDPPDLLTIRWVFFITSTREVGPENKRGGGLKGVDAEEAPLSWRSREGTSSISLEGEVLGPNHRSYQIASQNRNIVDKLGAAVSLYSELQNKIGSYLLGNKRKKTDSHLFENCPN